MQNNETCDLAGEMAIINVIVYDEQSYEDNELENTEVLYACVVTREMRTKLEEENLKNGSTEASDVALKDTLFLLETLGDISQCVYKAVQRHQSRFLKGFPGGRYLRINASSYIK
jgi:hypothetical protein